LSAAATTPRPDPTRPIVIVIPSDLLFLGRRARRSGKGASDVLSLLGHLGSRELGLGFGLCGEKFGDLATLYVWVRVPEKVVGRHRSSHLSAVPSAVQVPSRGALSRTQQPAEDTTVEEGTVEEDTVEDRGHNSRGGHRRGSRTQQSRSGHRRGHNSRGRHPPSRTQQSRTQQSRTHLSRSTVKENTVGEDIVQEGTVKEDAEDTRVEEDTAKAGTVKRHRALSRHTTHR
jgi:hypothetical protein